MSRKQLVRIALGRDSADVVVRGGRLVDVYAGEIGALTLPSATVASRPWVNSRRRPSDPGRKSSTRKDCSSLPV